MKTMNKTIKILPLVALLALAACASSNEQWQGQSGYKTGGYNAVLGPSNGIF